MKNPNSLISLRNNALISLTFIVVIFVGTWWIHAHFRSRGQDSLRTIETLLHTLTLIKQEGVISDKDWETLSLEERKNERWSTIMKLVPNMPKIVGIGSLTAGPNINIIKSITQKTGNTEYIPWLEASWTEDAQSKFMTTQKSIAEIIPVFAGLSEANSTENIQGKITLKTLIEYIQTNIVEQYGLRNVLGQIGIDSVEFIESSDIGMYEIPLQFEEVSNTNIINLLDFIGKTGEVTITESEGNISLRNHLSKPIKNTQENESKLSNLLITIKDMSIIPSKSQGQEKVPISTQNVANWDVRMTVQFYIRGVSRDHIVTLDATIMTLLAANNPMSLISRGNMLIKTCSNCPESLQIKDIVALLNNARTAYDSIILEEKNPKSTFSPIEILAHRTELMATIGTLQNKLQILESLIAPPQ